MATFTAPGFHTYSVPDGATEVDITLVGAGGGAGGGSDAEGGDGGRQVVTVSVSGGGSLEVYVGGGGRSGTADLTAANGGTGGDGYVSGGSGGAGGAVSASYVSGGGGGGGGSSAVFDSGFLVGRADGGGGGGGQASASDVEGGGGGGGGGSGGSGAAGGAGSVASGGSGTDAGSSGAGGDGGAGGGQSTIPAAGDDGGVATTSALSGNATVVSETVGGGATGAATDAADGTDGSVEIIPTAAIAPDGTVTASATAANASVSSSAVATDVSLQPDGAVNATAAASDGAVSTSTPGPFAPDGTVTATASVGDAGIISTTPADVSRPDVIADEEDQTHRIILPSLPADIDGVEIVESRIAPDSALRDGSTFSTDEVVVADLDPSVETYITDRQDRLSTYEYRVRVYRFLDGGARVSSTSPPAVAQFETYANYWFALERTGGERAVRRRTAESGPTYEHSALHHYTHATPQSDIDADADAFADVDVYLDDNRLFRGTFRTFESDTPADGATTATAFGPALPLRRDGPDKPVTYKNAARAEVIRDYWTNQITSVDVDAVVHDPPTEVIEDDTLVVSDTFSAFSTIAPNVADDEPVDTNTSLTLQQAAYGLVEDDLNGGTQTVADTPGSPPYHIDQEYLEAGNNTFPNGEFGPLDHDIPADRVIIAIHRDAVDTQGTLSTLSVTFNNTALEETTLLNANTERWSIWTAGDYTGDDLQEGDTPTLQVSTGDYAFNVDAFYLLDSRYGPYTFDDVTSLGEKLAGPKLHQPITVDLVDEPRPYSITEVRVDAAVSDTSGAFEWDISTTGGASSLTATSAAATLDFEAAGQYGSRLAPTVTLDGYGSNSWLADGAQGQAITSLDLSVTTETVPVVSDVKLTGSHFENLQRLHEGSDFRWVVDPTVARGDGLVVDSFVPSDPAVVRQPTWTAIDVQPSRDTLGYANAVTILYTDSNGDAQQFRAPANQSEVSRVGEEIRARVPRDDVETNDEARIAAVNELRKRIAEDTQSGRVEAVATAGVLPGFPYDVDAFGGPTPLDDSVSFRESADRNTMTLQFLRQLSPFERQLAAESAIQSLRGP